MELFKAKQNYKIALGNDSLSYLDLFLKKNQNKYSTVFILVDENTHKLCLPVFLNNLNHLVNYEVLEIPAGESNKVLSIAEQLWMAMSDLKADRNSLLINLGGGVVGDLGGFVASCYKRGIDFIQVPTTLLAMVDASIGGKTGIDIGHIKNLVGTFSAPKMVVVMPDFLVTLEEREIKSGYAEIIKHGLIADKKLWKSILKLDLKKSDSAYDFLIKRSIEIKNDVVSKDPNEKGLRKILNYGHTAGHAIESFFINTKFELLHGEAIIAGMLIENNISVNKGLLTEKKSEEVRVFLCNNFKLPILKSNDINAFVELMKNDKKNNSAIINCALLNDIGSCIEKVACSTDEIKVAFEEYILENK